MSLTLSTIITAARDRSPWFYRTRVTDAVVARALSDIQNELIGAAVRRDPQYLAQVANIVLHLDGADAPGTVGAGTSGGVPGSIDADGSFSTSQTTAGALIEANVTADGGAAVFVGDRVVTSSTATTITSTGANRATNQDVGRVVVIVAGAGFTERRSVLSNTADTWTISTGSDEQQWTTRPDTTSVLNIVDAAYTSDNTAAVFTAVPATTTSVGYLVRTNAQGVPFIDFTAPLVATMDVGVSLPSMQFPLDGTVWFTDGSDGPLALVSASDRFALRHAHSAYVVGQQLYLAGASGSWLDVASIALRYTPIAPPFTALTDTFLVPDHARPVLIAKAAAFMALRLAGTPDVQIDPSPHLAESARAESTYLANVSAAKRGRGFLPRVVW